MSGVVILGGGSGGYAVALRAAELGHQVTLVEEKLVGGTCLHRGCIPTKALLHAGEIAEQARTAATFGVRSTFEGIDPAGMRAYMEEVVSRNHRGLDGLLRSRGVNMVRGRGRLTDGGRVSVDGDDIPATHVVLATGSAPRTLDGLEPDGRQVVTSDHALFLEGIPATAIILGGGAIGVEFASAWRSLGTQVTVVEALPRLLPLEDEAMSRQLERALRRRGIGVRTGSSVTGVGVEADGTGVVVGIEGGEDLRAEVLLVAVGRVPVSKGLGYEEAGVKLDRRGYVVVDEYCRTSREGIYAVGDLIDTPQLAHAGFAEGILVAEHLSGEEVDPIDYSGVPRVTYSSPEVASVGYTEAQAAGRLGAEGVRAVTYDLAGNGRSAILRTGGAVKVVAEVDGPVLGVHMIGDRVGELIAEGQLIYNWGALPGEVAQLIHAHPTQSEAIGEAHLMLAGKPLHSHA